MRIPLVAVNQGLSAPPPPWKPYDRWKGEALQMQFWYLAARSGLREPAGWDNLERRQGEPPPLNALDTDVYNVTLSRVGKNALKCLSAPAEIKDEFYKLREIERRGKSGHFFKKSLHMRVHSRRRWGIIASAFPIGGQGIRNAAHGRATGKDSGCR